MAMSTNACAAPDVETLMEQHLWQDRVLLIFAAHMDNKSYVQQRKILDQNKTGFEARNLSTWAFIDMEFVKQNGKVLPHMATKPFYKHYNVRTADFTIILIGKDGTEKLRQSEPISAEKLFSIIDAMPMRQREINEK